jgi:hypothetical protein
MEEQKKATERLIDAAGNWVDTYRKLMVLRVVEHASRGASISIMGVLSAVIVIFLLLFLGLGLAWWVGEAMENMKAGFFIVGGFYAVVLLVILALAKKVLIPAIRNIIIKQVYEQN